MKKYIFRNIPLSIALFYSLFGLYISQGMSPDIFFAEQDMLFGLCAAMFVSVLISITFACSREWDVTELAVVSLAILYGMFLALFFVDVVHLQIILWSMFLFLVVTNIVTHEYVVLHYRLRKRSKRLKEISTG